MAPSKLLPLLAAWLACGCVAAPYRPSSGTQVVATVPRTADAPELTRLRRQLAATPTDLGAALALARRYIALGRASADPRYFGHAQAALAPWWDKAAAPSQVRLLRAVLLQNSHRFSEALADLQAVTVSEPANAEGWLTQATVLAVRGDFAEATASCARLSALADQLVSFTCLAAASVNTTRLAASERLLETTLARGGSAAPEVRVWALTLLAEMAARRGAADMAERRYRAALALAPDDSYLLGAYADFLLDRNRPADVLPLLRERRRIDALLLRYALALRAGGGGRAALADARSELQARFAAAAQRGDRVHLREEARFALFLNDDAAGALVLARQNWQVQKELADARILLEAARQAGDGPAAREVLDWLRRNGTQDVMLAALVRRTERAS